MVKGLLVSRGLSPEQSSRPVNKSETFEFLLEGSAFAISAHDALHDLLHMMQACAHRGNDGVVMQNGTQHGVVRCFAARAERSCECKYWILAAWM